MNTAERLLIPAVLALALVLLIVFPVPGPNHDIVLSIVAGLLGALTSRAVGKAGKDETTSTSPDDRAQPESNP
jgi:hypothetical protein